MQQKPSYKYCQEWEEELAGVHRECHEEKFPGVDFFPTKYDEHLL